MTPKTYLKIVFVCFLTSCLAIGVLFFFAKNPTQLAWGALVILALTFILVMAALRPIQRTIEHHKQVSEKISHELRTPLAVIKMNTEVALINVENQTREELIDVLKNTLEEIDRMSEITHFFLHDSDLRRNAQLLNINLGSVVEKKYEAMKIFAEKRDISLTFQGNTDIFLHGNVTALNELLDNLIKNSIAYTPSPGSIVVKVTQNDHGPLLSVSDTGIGIPPKDLPHIFEPFYRGENAYSQRRKKRGTGLGLVMVKNIVALHHAQISIESTLGKGTTFTIQFPAKNSFDKWHLF